MLADHGNRSTFPNNDEFIAGHSNHGHQPEGPRANHPVFKIYFPMSGNQLLSLLELIELITETISEWIAVVCKRSETMSHGRGINPCIRTARDAELV